MFMNVVIDDGSSYIKIVCDDRLEKISSRVVEGLIPVISGIGYSSDSYEVDGIRYSVSNLSSNTILTNNKEYQTSNHNLVLIHHALRKLCENESEVNVAVTIPIRDYFKIDGTVNEDKIKEKANHIKSSHKRIKYLSGQETIKIKNCYVFPEGIPAFIHAQSELNLSGNKFLVVDIGGTTTDVAALNSDNQIESNFSLNLGSFKYLKLLNNILCERFSFNTDLTDEQLFKVVSSNSLFDENDVKDDVNKIKTQFKNDLSEKIQSHYSEMRFFDNIVLSGGGVYLADLNYNNVVKTNSPQFDNALGIKKLMRW